MERFNLALICTQAKDSQWLIALSQELDLLAPSTYILGKNSHPHVTVCQFRDDRVRVEALWQRVGHLRVDFMLHPECIYYALHSNKEHGGRYLGIGVNKPAALVDYQQKVMQAIAPLQPTSPTGYAYDPHFTLGCHDLSASPNLLQVIAGYEKFCKSGIPLSLALGPSGPDGQFESVLFTQNI